MDAVVIDDGSIDRTATIAAEHGCRVLRLCRDLGIGGAVQAGFRLAFTEGFDYAVQIDADGQHPPNQIARLLAELDAAPTPNLVVGSRRLTFGIPVEPLRRLGQAWLRFWLFLLCRVRVTDPTSGFRLYGPPALRLFQQTYPYDYPEPESLAVARAFRLSIRETAVEMRPRQGGQSSIAGLQSAYYMTKVTLAITLVYVRNRCERRPRVRGRQGPRQRQCERERPCPAKQLMSRSTGPSSSCAPSCWSISYAWCCVNGSRCR